MKINKKVIYILLSLNIAYEYARINLVERRN